MGMVILAIIGVLFLVGVLGNELLNIVAGIFFSARSVLVVIGLIVVVLLVVGL